MKDWTREQLAAERARLVEKLKAAEATGAVTSGAAIKQALEQVTELLGGRKERDRG